MLLKSHQLSILEELLISKHFIYYKFLNFRIKVVSKTLRDDKTKWLSRKPTGKTNLLYESIF